MKANKERSISEVLTTADLERRTGLRRSTIYFYIRRGLLPEPQRKPGGHALYSEDHVALLLKIRDLKDRGASLPDIKRQLLNEISELADSGTDLVEEQVETVRTAVIEVATYEFSTRGYRRTSVATILDKVGINEHDFYRLFPSKFDLLVECFRTLAERALNAPVAKMMSQDPGEKVLRGLVHDSGLTELGSVLSAAVHSETLPEDYSYSQLVKAWDVIIGEIVRDFESLIPTGSPPLAVSEELLAYALMGAYRNVTTRTSWDDRYDFADVLRAQMFVVLCVYAGLAGETDIRSKLAGYEPLILELSSGLREGPPPLDLQSVDSTSPGRGLLRRR